MAKVQKPLPGLSRVLGIETQGLLRLDALESVQPVLEIQDFLNPNPWQAATGALAAIGNTLQLTVPDKKFWRVKVAACSWTNPVAASAFCGMYLRRISGTGVDVRIGPPGDSGHLAVSMNSYQNGYSAAFDYANLAPGDSVILRLDALTGGGPVNAAIYVQFQELDL